MTAHAAVDASPHSARTPDGVATLTLNRPAARNALSDALLAALTGELDRIAADRSVRAVIARGDGPGLLAPVTTSRR